MQAIQTKSNFWQRYKEKYGHLPWYKRYEFLLPLLLVVLILGLCLPTGQPPNFSGWLIVGAFILSVFFWVIGVLTDVEKPRWLRAIAALGLIFVFGFCFYRYSGARWDLFTRTFLNPSMMQGAWSELLLGLEMTLKLALVSMAISIFFGLIIAVMRSFKNPILEFFLVIYIDFFRAIPLVVLLVFVYYALPFLGITLDPYLAAILAVSLNYSAYVAEVFRSGIESIHRGQVEAARALGLKPLQAMRLVILPQAVRVVVPPLTGLMVALLKDTALATIIGLPELLYKGIQVMIWKANPTPLVTVSLIYLLVLLPLTRISSYLEKRSKKWVKTAR
ncbi:MAG: amino acid ABC transporter permease [Caldiserica bacterium]|jgi:His/Glu/Gln/Arg/opine family amino acid ABC transporter permease subunit|nr:amino acid ABC transporter permease [Caldisericota bacterium]MDH7562358.1 amino acid ABC transporter permease [Caldisericota bacterium]